MIDFKGQKLEIGDRVNIKYFNLTGIFGTIFNMSPTIGDVCVRITESNHSGYRVGAKHYYHPSSLVKIGQTQDEIVEDNVEIANIFNYNFG